jgi:hypothetical protein
MEIQLRVRPMNKAPKTHTRVLNSSRGTHSPPIDSHLPASHPQPPPSQPPPGHWVPLIDYAIKKGVSMSTLRRQIKSHKLTYKIERGRYLVWDEVVAELNSASQIQALELSLQKAQEEIAELKTLIAFYEEKIPQPRFNN